MNQESMPGNSMTSNSAQPRLTPAAERFVTSVLELGPRIAVFDCDGTLWSGDSGADFFYWEIERGLLPPDLVRWALARYDDYKRGLVDEDTMCGEMVSIHQGIACDRLERLSVEFFDLVVAPRIFPEMRQLTQRLAASGCELWAVSSTNEWVVREGARRFGIPDSHILAACVEIEGACATGRLVRVPSGPGKALAIGEFIPGPVDGAFGNSVFDADMLALAAHAFAINPNPDLERLARERSWKVYFPDSVEQR
jgi:phosphoserine phosphatase